MEVRKTVTVLFADVVGSTAMGEKLDPEAWRRVRAGLLAGRGDVAEDERLGREAVAIAERTDFFEARALPFADLADGLRLAAGPEEATDAAQRAVQDYENKGSVAGANRVRARFAEALMEA
jgi:class 3 adenylate cyclase